MEPGEAAAAHAAECEWCAEQLARRRALVADLRAFGRLARAAEAPPHVEQAVMAAFRERANRTRGAWSARRWLSAAAALAMVVTAAWVLWRPRPSVTAAMPAPAENDLRGFLPVPYRAAPIEGGYIVRVRMPRGALVSLGMPVPSGEREEVQADLWLAGDGQAQAVRLVH